MALRITINSFPLSVYERSEMNRSFHPIALAILSQETHLEITFFSALTHVASYFNIKLVIHDLTIDELLFGIKENILSIWNQDSVLVQLS